MPLKRNDPQQHALWTQHTRKFIRIMRSEYVQQQVAACVRDRQMRDTGHGQRQLGARRCAQMSASREMSTPQTEGVLPCCCSVCSTCAV